MQNLCDEWLLKHISPGKSMTRYLSLVLLLGIIFAVEVKGKKKTKFSVTGIVLNKDGEGLKKVKLILTNEDGKKVGKDKTIDYITSSVQDADRNVIRRRFIVHLVVFCPSR